MDSILTSVKALQGIQEEDESFDQELIMDINSVFMVLYQLGVGPKKPFSITDKSQTWSEFLGDRDDISLVRSYMYLKVRLLFDPPQSGVLHEAMERQVEECEWRINVQAESPSFPEEGGG